MLDAKGGLRMRAMAKLVASLSLVVVSASLAGQIVGGAEGAKFEPGDVTLFAEDFSSIPLGDLSPKFKLLSGSYEVAQFKGRRWIRPLDKGLRLIKVLKFPEEFSVEFAFYAFEAGGPYMQFTLLSSEGVREGGKKGFLLLKLGREFRHDYLELRASDKPREYFPRAITKQVLPPDALHRVALQVRRGQLRLFVDGKRAALIPFRPEGPIEGMGFYWSHSFETKTPYRDSPVLLTDLRVARYSRREWVAGRGGRAQLLLVLGGAELEEKHPLRESLTKFGAVETSKGWWLPLPGEPFAEPGSWEVVLSTEVASAWAKRVNDLLKQAREFRPDAHLLVEGFAPEVEDKEARRFWGKQVRFWLAALRARALALWLAQLGLPPKGVRVLP